MNDINIKEFDITVKEVSACYEDITLCHKWEGKSYSTGNRFFLAFGIEGKNILKVENKELIIGKNDIVFIPHNMIYRGESPEIPARMMVVRFEATDICGFYEPFSLSPNKWEKFEEIFFEMRDKFIVEPFGYKTELKGMLYTVITRIIKELASENKEERGYKKIKNSILYIHENYTDPEMSIGKVAEMSGISEVHFRRIFKEVFDMSPLSYVTEIRLKKAKELLIHTGYSIGVVADMVGIYDEVYFSKYFKKHTGKTPNEFRKQGVSYEGF